MDLSGLYDALNSVTAIPIVPYRNGQIDYAGHAKNIRYLMRNNTLDNGRKRVIAIAGTSLIHHFTPDEQMRLMEVTGREMGRDGVLMSGIVPNPIATAESLIRAQAGLPRPPDVYLLMPLTGVADPDGIYEMYRRLGDRLGAECGVRFVLYMRTRSHMKTIIRLINDSPHFVGVKVGTGEEDVPPLIDGVKDNGLVMWGVGDRCTRAAELGARGHTSGIAVAVARASDGINNAQRAGDYATSRRIEQDIAALEELRFMNDRQYNYSAVVEALILGGWDDVEGGEGGPFNPRVPPPVAERVRAALERIRAYH
jgi:dihydrodipicolinate synthase/N-acetylneuraminate lyase